MLYMVIERFKPGSLEQVAKRFRERGRMLPDGVAYHSSWLNPEGTICYQVMEAAKRELLETWIG